MYDLRPGNSSLEHWQAASPRISLPQTVRTQARAAGETHLAEDGVHPRPERVPVLVAREHPREELGLVLLRPVLRAPVRADLEVLQLVRVVRPAPAAAPAAGTLPPLLPRRVRRAARVWLLALPVGLERRRRPFLRWHLRLCLLLLLRLLLHRRGRRWMLGLRLGLWRRMLLVGRGRDAVHELLRRRVGVVGTWRRGPGDVGHDMVRVRIMAGAVRVRPVHRDRDVLVCWLGLGAPRRGRSCSCRTRRASSRRDRASPGELPWPRGAVAVGRTHLNRARVVGGLGHHRGRGAVWVGRGGVRVGLLGRVRMAERASGRHTASPARGSA